MGALHRPARAGMVVTLGVGLVALTGAFAAARAAAVARPAVNRSSVSLTTIRDSLPTTTDKITGAYRSARMTVEVALAPRDGAGLSAELTALYDPSSPQYEHWLAQGAFYARYAPTTAALAGYLRARDLVVSSTASPFLLRATGSSAAVAAAFHTTLSTYRDPRGVSYFSNSATVRLPSTVAGAVLGVVGLADTVRPQSNIERAKYTEAAGSVGRRASAYTPGSCESSYPTKAEFFTALTDGNNFAFGYGAAPGCTGLSPSQTNSIYGAPDAGAKGKGKGVSLAVFELSAYRTSDIATWARTFYGSRYHAPLANVSVDGGPLAPVCPTGDQCPSSEEGYGGDIEVDADIENDLAVAPDAHRLIVYNAPNDQTGQTELDEYNLIAKADTTAVVSSSWGECENDAGATYVQAENVVFEQMALQGQSVFSSAGDTGAFECIRSDGTDIPDALDPASQPWVTSVGGTSLRPNPGAKADPAYPTGAETVWNVDNLCNASPADGAEGGQTGYFWCGQTGAGGGGASQFWGRPSYQHGPGVTNAHTVYANGSTNCSLAAAGTPCREVPDVSADADEYTPYAEYCSGSENTPNSICATVPPSDAGSWFGIGGTSLSSPLWSAIIADRDSYQGRRSGNINPLVYRLLDHGDKAEFHDITGKGQGTKNNGLFRVTGGYDEATGIGTPIMAKLITARF